ncbi:MAG: archease [Patescibacteria group bacterium]
MKEKKFEILEHTADLKIRSFGKTKEDLFKNSLFGMSFVQKTELPAGEKIFIKLKIESADAAALLIDFLSEVLTQSQINRAVFYNADFSKLSDTELEAEIKGVKIAEFDEDIKAVTYHGAEIVQKDGVYEATVIYDI